SPVQGAKGAAPVGPTRAPRAARPPPRLVIADVDNSGTLDIVASNSRSGDVSVLLATSAATFAPARTFVADAEPQALALGDFNADGLLDAVTATQGSDAGATVALLRNRGHGVLHGVEDVAAGNGPSALAIAHL